MILSAEEVEEEIAFQSYYFHFKDNVIVCKLQDIPKTVSIGKGGSNNTYIIRVDVRIKLVCGRI
jgi:hypothetical protein